jgi:hypothetical protein
VDERDPVARKRDGLALSRREHDAPIIDYHDDPPCCPTGAVSISSYAPL